MDLRPLSGFHELTVLELGDTPVADIEPLRPLQHLHELWLNGTKVTDLAQIRSLKAGTAAGLVDS